jgi:hypothetical protein
MNARIQNSPENVVGRYAHLTLARDRFTAAQKPVPPALMREIQQIEAQAQARMSPQQLQHALHFVEQEKVRLLQQERQDQAAHDSRVAQQAAQLRQMNADTLARRFGRNADLDVRNAEEFNRIRKGLPLKRGTPKPAPIDPGLLEQATQNATRHLDLKGKGFTAKEWIEKLEWLWEYHGTHDFRAKAKQIGLRPSQDLDHAMARYKEQELVERLAGPKEYKVAPTEQDRRKAIITATMAEHLAKSGSDRELDDFHRPGDFREARRIHEDPTETDSLRGDISRALMEHYPEDEAPDYVPEYTDKDYEGADDDE